MAMNVRERGKEHWYNPQRDLLHIWLPTMMRGAAYAADPRSSIYQWLERQIPKADIQKRIRDQLKALVLAIKEGKSANLEDILSPDLVDWEVFQAIMFAVGILLFKQYNKFYRGGRMTDQHGGVDDPVRNVDELGIMVEFDKLVEKHKLII